MKLSKTNLLSLAMVVGLAVTLFLAMSPPMRVNSVQVGGGYGIPVNTMVSQKNCCQEMNPVGPGLMLHSGPLQYQYNIPEQGSEDSSLFVFVAAPNKRVRVDVNTLFVRDRVTYYQRPLSGSDLTRYDAPAIWRHPGPDRLDIMQLRDNTTRRVPIPYIAVAGEPERSDSLVFRRVTERLIAWVTGMSALILLLMFLSRVRQIQHAGESLMALGLFAAVCRAPWRFLAERDWSFAPSYIGAFCMVVFVVGLALRQGAALKFRTGQILGLSGATIALLLFAVLGIAETKTAAPYFYLAARIALFCALASLAYSAFRYRPRGHVECLALIGLAAYLLIDTVYPSDRLATLLEATALACLSVSIAGLAIERGTTLAKDIVTWFRLRLSLSQQITQQQKQLKIISAELQSQIRRSAILEERQRLMRDMHDGIGGQLVSLLTRIRRKKVNMEDVEYEVEAGLNDLRLVVNALDAKDQSLAEAFGKLRYRIEAQAAAMNIDIDWQQEGDHTSLGLAPQKLLMLTRLVQEVFTNAFKHAGASMIEFKSVVSEQTGHLDLVIADDGLGIDEERLEQSLGAGLANIRTRAMHLDAVAQRSAGTSGKGVLWKFTVPLERV